VNVEEEKEEEDNDGGEMRWQTHWTDFLTDYWRCEQ